MSRAELPILADPSAQIDLQAFRATLERTVSGEVRFDRLSRALYSTDASVYQIVPVGVVLPKTEADVVAVVRACGQHRVPLTARGGGTSQAGQAIGAGVSLDFSKHFGQVLEINTAERCARVQPGCVLDDLNEALRPHGLLFAPDISTSNRATIGGMVANNSSGTHSLIHGKTIDHVLELKVVLADGSAAHLRESARADQGLEAECYRVVQRLATEHAVEIDRRFPKILRRVGGYNLDRFVGRPFNLAHLIVGSEGTLAVIVEAKLRLVEMPRAKAVLVIQFDELLDALAATPSILKHQPSAVEVIDRYILDSTKLNPEASRLRDFLDGDPGAILIVEFYGGRAEELPPRLDDLEADLRRQGFGSHYHRATESAAQGRIWKLRKAALGLSMAEKGDAKALSFVEDTAVAPERLRDYIAEFLELIARHGTTAGVYAHASVGCLHVRPIVNLKTEAGVRQFEAIAAGVADLVLKYGGALSGEHGDGLVRTPFQEKMFGPTLYQAFRAIKRTFDPQGIFNPGKIVDAPPLTSNLRYGPKYITLDVPTTFDFSADGGLTRAAELCAGIGECRKTRDGTMCPSFQATRNEKDSTRGRANTLRLALTGQLDMQGLTDPAVKEALDLCLECKACKSECPTNVDMARLKAEVMHQYYRKHGLPWRNWVFGNVARWSGLEYHPWVYPLLPGWFARSRVGRWLGEKLLGIDRRRPLPRPVVYGPNWDSVLPKPSDATWQRFPAGTFDDPYDDPTSPLPKVLIFPDTFTNCYEPSIGLAAVSALAESGVFASPGDPISLIDWPWRYWCCGRPLISNGMLNRAVENARQNVESLFPWAARGKPIIACEPSCILTIKDDYPALLRGEERKKAEVVAAACQTFEEFMDSALSGLPEGVKLKALTSPARRILVQAHCHQRSLVGMGPIMRLLRRIPGAEVIDLDAGCCGMAGSFGYEKEHYEISRLVGEQRLFPALRQAGPESIVVAPGFSCRQQIKHFTGITTLHPAELLHGLLRQS